MRSGEREKYDIMMGSRTQNNTIPPPPTLTNTGNKLVKKLKVLTKQAGNNGIEMETLFLMLLLFFLNFTRL